MAAHMTASGQAFGRSVGFGVELELAIELAHRAGQIQMDRYERLERIEIGRASCRERV